MLWIGLVRRRRGFVEILCVRCGTTLKDDARFCNNCGMLVPSHPFSLSSSKLPPSPQGAIVSGQHDIISDIMREQVIQSPPRTPRHSIHNEPPAWMSQLDHQPQER